MAIKVIKEGKKPEDAKMSGQCYNCKSVVECLCSDTKVFHDQRDGSTYSITCPVCKKTMSVNKTAG